MQRLKLKSSPNEQELTQLLNRIFSTVRLENLPNSNEKHDDQLVKISFKYLCHEILHRLLKGEGEIVDTQAESDTGGDENVKRLKKTIQEKTINLWVY